MSAQGPVKPAKKQSKWSPEEDALIIELRGSGMKWEDISNRLPGRSSISCRLHYQNYLEKRSPWDDERKTKLALVYERMKPQIWAKVAEELGVPWRAAEAMHWQLGEAEMARRAGAVPFALAAATTETGHKGVGSHHQAHAISAHGSIARDMRPSSAQAAYTDVSLGVMGRSAALLSHRESMTRSPPMGIPLSRQSSTVGSAHPCTDAAPSTHTFAHQQTRDVNYTIGPGLAPINMHPLPRTSGQLPSIAELTAGIKRPVDPTYGPTSEPLRPDGSWREYGGMPYYAEYDRSNAKRSASPGPMVPEPSSYRRRKL